MDPKTLTAEVHDRLRYRGSTWPQNMREWLTIYRGFHGTAREVEQALETLVAAGHVERWDNVGLTCYTLRDNTRQRNRGFDSIAHYQTTYGVPDTRTAIRDLMADLMHVIRAQEGMDLDAELRWARQHVERECRAEGN